MDSPSNDNLTHSFEQLWHRFMTMNIEEGGLTSVNETCNAILTKNNTLIEIDRGWEGIPETLVINLILCLIVGSAFWISRSRARRSQQLRHESQEKYNNWLEFIYGDRTSNPTGYTKSRKICKNPIYANIFADVLKPFAPFHATEPAAAAASVENAQEHVSIDHDVFHDPVGAEAQAIIPNPPQSESMSNRSSFLYSPDMFQRFLPAGVFLHINNWISDLFYITDLDLFLKKGPDAYQYLQFERYIIYFFSFLTFLCIVVVLPVNVQGNNHGKAFQRTTMSNLPDDSQLFWVHAIAVTLVIIMGYSLMNNFSKSLKTDDDLMSRNTLLIRRLPLTPGENLKDKIKACIEEKFPEQVVTGIELVYDCCNLSQMEQTYVNILHALESTYHENVKLGVSRVQMKPYMCGSICGCVCCCSAVDAYEFLGKEKADLQEKILKRLDSMQDTTVGSAFVSFKTERSAMKVYRELKKLQDHFATFRRLCPCCTKRTGELKLEDSLVCYAPYPSDINWNQVASNVQYSWLKKMILNCFLFVIFFFLSTPAIALKLFEVIYNKHLIQDGIGHLNSTLTEFLSPLMLMMMAMLLPMIVTQACYHIPFITISALNHAVMSRVYFFLLMMVIILPSAGFISINAMLENIVSSSSSANKFRWNCLFPVNNGAFFVIYTLQVATIGNVMEILRIPELISYTFQSMFLRSSMEFQKARKMILFEFPIGTSYARLMLIYTMTITYSIACPIIAPCGLFYIISKHVVDRYNIYNVYTPSKIDGHIHWSAILYVFIGQILMLFQVFGFCITKTQYSSVSIYLLVLLIIVLLIFTFNCFYYWFRNINHVTYKATTKSSHKKQDSCICSYVAPVFYNIIDDGLLNNSV